MAPTNIGTPQNITANQARSIPNKLIPMKLKITERIEMMM